jgi:(4S)-4-hydroxy-5-phosphonooxypentane-2,3-dione isomerase
LSKVVLSGYIVVPDSDLEAVIAAIPTHISKTRKEVGCLIFKVTQDSNEKNIFNVYEEYIDKEAFSIHQVRTKDSSWWQVTANAERHYQINEQSGV